jgi:hypothetical protein
MTISGKNMLGSVIGLPMTIATQLPRMLGKGEEREHLRKTQAGSGTGAELARASGQRAVEDARSIAAGGEGPSTAFAAREGMRQARDVRRDSDQNAAAVGAAEAMQATQMLRSSDIAKRAAIGQVGAAGGGALAAFDAQSQAATSRENELADATLAHDREMELGRLTAGQQAVPEVPALEGEEAAVAPQAAAQTQQQSIDQGQQDLDYIRALRDPKVRFAIGEGMTPEEAVSEFFPGTMKSGAQ